MKQSVILALLIFSQNIFCSTFSPSQAPVSEFQVENPSKNKISDTQFIIGGSVGLIWGFGVGHAVQGRWKESGYIFTIFDSVGLYGFLSHIISPKRGPNKAGVFYGAMYLTSRVIGTIDVWTPIESEPSFQWKEKSHDINIGPSLSESGSFAMMFQYHKSL